LIINNWAEIFPKLEPDTNARGSGYRSIHYLCSHFVARKRYYAEIQLRTLLQDAWAELEHKLSYNRGNVHPFIIISFILFAQDIATNDLLLSYLKNIHDDNDIKENFCLKQKLPIWFDYELELFPEKLYQKNLVKKWKFI